MYELLKKITILARGYTFFFLASVAILIIITCSQSHVLYGII